MNREKDMTSGKPMKHIFLFALPLIFTNLGQQFYMIVDASVVGRGVGVNALAAVGATDWCNWLILWVVQALTQGFASYISKYFGRKDYAMMNRVIVASIELCMGFGLVLTVMGLAAVKPVLTLLKTPDNIYGGATVYLFTLMSGTMIVMAYNMSAAILRAFGDGKTPLIAMGIAAITNVVLDITFVICFKWGIFGAAIATLTAQLIAFIYCLFRIKRIEFIHLKKEMWVPNIEILKELFLFGLPLAFQYIVIAISGMIVQSAINLQGTTFIAGYTASNKLYSLLESSAISLGFAVTTYTAQNYGAGMWKRVRSGVNSAIAISAIMSAAVACIMIVFGRYIVQLFLSASEANAVQALDIAYKYLVAMSIFLFPLYMHNVTKYALNGLGNSICPMISGIIEFIIRVICAMIFVKMIGNIVLYYIEPFAWIGSASFMAVSYYVLINSYQRKSHVKLNDKVKG